MSKDEQFRIQLQEIFEQIFENRNLVRSIKTGRQDYMEVQYTMPDFWAESPERDIALNFRHTNKYGNLSDRWERMHNHLYGIYDNGKLIAGVRRSPKREYILFSKPYNSREIFIDNSIQSVLSLFDNVKISFSPGRRKEYV